MNHLTFWYREERKKRGRSKKKSERNGRFSNLGHQIRVSESVFFVFSNRTIPQVHLTTILLLLLSLLSAPFLSGSGEAESTDFLSPSTPLHNPGNILSLCSQPSGDLTIPSQPKPRHLASGSAAAIARWSKCLLLLTCPARVVHTPKGQNSRALLFLARLLCEELILNGFSWVPAAI